MRRTFLVAAIVWIAANVVLTILGVLLRLGDSPVTSTREITLGRALLDSGTIVSPPLVFMVVAVALLWPAMARNRWAALVATALLAIGTTVVGWDTQGGLHVRAPLYSSSDWNIVLVLGWLFVALSAALVVSGIARLVVVFRN